MGTNPLQVHRNKNQITESNAQGNPTNIIYINAQLEQALDEMDKQRNQYEAKMQMMKEQFQARLQTQTVS